MWLEQSSGTTNRLSGIWFNNNNKNGWIVGDGGTILLTGNGGISGTDDPRSISQDFPLKVKCYPNPFCSSTTVEFELEHPGISEIMIMNHFGQVIDKISHSGQKGKNQVTWNAGLLPPGIYFCQVTSGKQVATCKLVKHVARSKATWQW
jgi:hypothetical protein